MRVFLLTSLVLLLAAAAPAAPAPCTEAAGNTRCSCRRADVVELKDRATAIVVGTVVADSAAALDFHGTGDRFAGRVVTLVVGARWKGAAADTLRVRTGRGGGDCGFSFRVGETYLVFARGSSDNLWTNICWPTAHAAVVGPAVRHALGRSVWNRYPMTHPLRDW